MKFQWTMLVGILFALIVAFFAVMNVEAVTVNYLLGTAKWPLIIVILGSVLMGGLIIGSVGLIRIYSLQRQLNRLQSSYQQLEAETDVLKEEKDDSSNISNQS